MPRGRMRSKTEKRARFAGYGTAYTQNPGLAGQWRAQFAHPDRPLVLEVGTARGEFLLGLAQLLPERNYVGLERKGERLYHIARDAEALGLTNLRLLREDAYVLGEVFAPGEVDQIWITFPDPYPKDRHAKHRLTGPHYLAQYRKVLAPGGWVDLKTDSAALFAFTLETLAEAGLAPERQTDNLHQSPWLDAETGTLTGYERRFLAEGLPTHYLRFRFA